MTKQVLSGVRVLECTTAMAGPYATLQLANLGAEVIKVEPPSGDSTRHWGPFVNGVSIPFLAVNRGKKSVALDLKSDAGRDAFKALVATADVVVENFRPGTMKRLGLGYEDLRRQKPDLIYCAISGYGQEGPYSHRGGYDLVAQGETGIMSITGEPGRPPAKSGVPVIDLGTGLFAAQGILAALLHRRETGEGQFIDASLFDTGVSMCVWEAHTYLATGEVPGPLGSANRLLAPYGAFEASDGYFTVGAGPQNLWLRFCEVLDLQALLEMPQFATPEVRRENQVELTRLIEERTREQTRAYWLERLERAGIPGGPINRMNEVLSDPHTVARGLVTTIQGGKAGEVQTLGVPYRLSETPLVVSEGVPELGEHNEQLLAEVGGRR